MLPSPHEIPSIQPSKDDFKVRLARDLQYSGILTDDATLEKFIYDELNRRIGAKTAYVRRSSFSELQVKNTNATKKAVRKVVQKIPVKRIVTQQVVRHCSVCEKAGHTKLNCPGANRPEVKCTKKVNYVYQNEVEESEESEKEYIVEEEVDEEEEEEIEDEEEYVEYIDDESALE